MEPESRYTLIGAIALLLIAAAAGAMMWLAGAGTASNYYYYSILFNRQSLEGLQIGGEVRMRGLKVGRVESFGIEPENINQVGVVVRVDKQTPASVDTTAQVNRNLVTGIAHVDLITPNPPGAALISSSGAQQYPRIAEGARSMDLLTDSAENLVQKADQTLRSLNALLSEDNRQAVSSILSSLQTTSESLDRRLNTFEIAASRISDTATAFETAARDIGKTLSKVDRRVGPLSRDATRAMTEMRIALREISRTARSVENSTRQLTRRTSDVADIGITELRATARDLRHGVDLLSRTLDRLQDPRAALLGPGEAQLGPGENQ